MSAIKLQAGNYLTRTGQILVLTEAAIQSGAAKLICRGPQVYTTKGMDSKTGESIKIQLSASELVIESVADKSLIVCSPYPRNASTSTVKICPQQSVQVQLELNDHLICSMERECRFFNNQTCELIPSWSKHVGARRKTVQEHNSEGMLNFKASLSKVIKSQD